LAPQPWWPWPPRPPVLFSVVVAAAAAVAVGCLAPLVDLRAPSLPPVRSMEFGRSAAAVRVLLRVRAAVVRAFAGRRSPPTLRAGPSSPPPSQLQPPLVAPPALCDCICSAAAAAAASAGDNNDEGCSCCSGDATGVSVSPPSIRRPPRWLPCCHKCSYV